MEFPYLTPYQTTANTLSRFGGYCHNTAVKPGEWFDMENLSSEKFPLLTVRKKRGMLEGLPFEGPGQLMEKNGLWSVQGPHLIGQNPLKGEGLFTFRNVFEKPPNLVSFSSCLVDVENGLWFSCRQGDYRKGAFTYDRVGGGNKFSVYLCDETGQGVFPNHFGSSSPEECSGGDLWLDTTETPAVLKRYYEDSASFVPLPTYLRISLEADLSDMEPGDMVEITFPTAVGPKGERYQIYDMNTPKKVLSVGVNGEDYHYFVVEGALEGCVGYYWDEGTLTVETALSQSEGYTLKGASPRVQNAIPPMDYVVSAGNRLWGCRYGVNRKGEFVNEIYASALGSFRVWEKFEGVSSDSYTLSCGTDGPFTGGAVYGGAPVFFKENALHRVYGSYPFSVTPLACNGIMQGSHNSAVVVNNQLIYQSRKGLCTYTGNHPTLLDLPFGQERYHGGVAAGNQSHYYLSVFNEDNTPVLFVYDTTRGILTKEEGIAAVSMVARGEEIYATVPVEGGYRILLVTGAKGKIPPCEETVSFFAQTGLLGQNSSGKRYLHGVEMWVTVEPGSFLDLKVQYNGKGEFYSLATLTHQHCGQVSLPLRLKPCHCFALRLEGQGEVTLHSLTHLTRKGGKGKCI